MAMSEQDVKVMLSAFTRSREQFTTHRSKARGSSTGRRMTERERDIRDAFRNR